MATDPASQAFDTALSGSMAFGHPQKDSNRRRRVLLISYAFPPVGGAGVQRAVKFVKYLPDFGWDATVLTVSNPSVPVRDSDLLAETRNMTVVRARTLEPSYRHKEQLLANNQTGRTTIKSSLRRLASHLLWPDPQILWNPIAYRCASRLIRAQTFDAVLVTGPPFSSMLLGRRLKKRHGIPLVLDFRDEWSLSSRYLENRSAKRDQRGSEQRVIDATLRTADAVIATTRRSAHQLSSQCQAAGNPVEARCIFNGFDPDDFGGLRVPKPLGNRFRLVYTGTLWNLTDVSPLVQAVEQLDESSPELCEQLELVFIGRRTAQQQAILDRLQATRVALQLHDYLPHREAIEQAAAADGLCLLLADQPGAERVVPGKLFEYLALRRPILAITPKGETAELLSRSSLAHTFECSQTPRIQAWLERAISHRSFEGNPGPANSSMLGMAMGDLTWCTRSELTRQLSEVLSEVAVLPKL